MYLFLKATDLRSFIVNVVQIVIVEKEQASQKGGARYKSDCPL